MLFEPYLVYEGSYLDCLSYFNRDKNITAFKTRRNTNT